MKSDGTIPQARLEFEDGYWNSGKMTVMLRNPHNGGVKLGEGLTADRALHDAIKTVKRLLKELEARK